MSRYGHIASYYTICELETEITYNASKSGYLPAANRGTGCAFDNFDRFVETISGKDTLHDAVGIAYETIVEEPEKEEEEARILMQIRQARKTFLSQSCQRNLVLSKALKKGDGKYETEKKLAV